MRVARALTATLLTIAVLSIESCKDNSDPLPPPPGTPILPQELFSNSVNIWAEISTEAVAQLGPPPVGPPPFVEARVYAMAALAVHDAVNAIYRRYKPYALDTVATNASPEAAVGTAAHDVLSALLPDARSFLDQNYADFISNVRAEYYSLADQERITRGVTLGKRTAEVVLARRATDGSDHAQGPYTPGNTPGAYRPTPPFDGPPFNGFVDAPQWGNVTPFVMTSSSQFRPPAPYDVTSSEYAADLNEVKTLGSATGSTRTAEQTKIAKFWEENSPMAWYRIARIAAQQNGLDTWDAARLFALLQLAEMEGYLGCLEAKYTYNFWRPITAIRLADTDGNGGTVGDSTWQSLDVTPPAPDYPSAHACAGGAAAQVLKTFFGRDDFPFSTTSSSLPGVTRSYSSFSQACDENGLSRIYVGFHFRLAVERGEEQGRSIGSFVIGTALPRVP